MPDVDPSQSTDEAAPTDAEASPPDDQTPGESDAGDMTNRPIEAAVNVTAALAGIIGTVIGVMQQVVPFVTAQDKLFATVMAVLLGAGLVRCSQLAMARRIDLPLAIIAVPFVVLLAMAYLFTVDPSARSQTDDTRSLASSTGSSSTDPATQEPEAQPSGIQQPKASAPGTQVRRTGKLTLYSEPGHSIDLDSRESNWRLSTSAVNDFYFEYYRVTATSPAQLAVVNSGAGFDDCNRATDYRSLVDLQGLGLRDGGLVTVCVQTNEGRYAALALTVYGDGVTFPKMVADIRVWEPIAK